MQIYIFFILVLETDYNVVLDQWFLTFFTYLILSSNKITRFILIHLMVLIY